MATTERNSKRRQKASVNAVDRVPPHNNDAERGVLGSLLLLNEAIDEIADELRAEHFYQDAHQLIYAAIVDMHERGIRGIDGITLGTELERRGTLEQCGGASYLVEILNCVPHAAHARYYSEIVRNTWTQRAVISACTAVITEAYDPDDVSGLLESAEREIFAILEQQGAPGRIEIADVIQDALVEIDARLRSDSKTPGLTSGFIDLDNLTTGFQPTELVILAARPSMGKTAFVCNIAEAVARETGKGVLFFSLEQSNQELAERFLCIAAEVNGHDLRKGQLTLKQRDALMRASDRLSEMPLFLDDKAARTMTQISTVARRQHRKSPLGLVIVDYLQLIEPDDKRTPREQQISGISRRLKFLAKELRVPVIALSQLNRSLDSRPDKRPRLSDLRESGAIEQDADMVMFLHRPEAYDPDDRPGEAEVIVGKHRSGPTGIVKLTWRNEFMRFENFSSFNEPAMRFDKL